MAIFIHLSKARETTNQDANGFACGGLLKND
jgi:hypothetical protein